MTQIPKSKHPLFSTDFQPKITRIPPRYRGRIRNVITILKQSRFAVLKDGISSDVIDLNDFVQNKFQPSQVKPEYLADIANKVKDASANPSSKASASTAPSAASSSIQSKVSTNPSPGDTQAQTSAFGAPPAAQASAFGAPPPAPAAAPALQSTPAKTVGPPPMASAFGGGMSNPFQQTPDLPKPAATQETPKQPAQPPAPAAAPPAMHATPKLEAPKPAAPPAPTSNTAAPPTSSLGAPPTPAPVPKPVGNGLHPTLSVPAGTGGSSSVGLSGLSATQSLGATTGLNATNNSSNGFVTAASPGDNSVPLESPTGATFDSLEAKIAKLQKTRQGLDAAFVQTKSQLDDWGWGEGSQGPPSLLGKSDKALEAERKKLAAEKEEVEKAKNLANKAKEMAAKEIELASQQQAKVKEQVLEQKKAIEAALSLKAEKEAAQSVLASAQSALSHGHSEDSAKVQEMRRENERLRQELEVKIQKFEQEKQAFRKKAGELEDAYEHPRAGGDEVLKCKYETLKREYKSKTKELTDLKMENTLFRRLEHKRNCDTRVTEEELRRQYEKKLADKEAIIEEKDNHIRALEVSVKRY